jgi:hypothetical protein
MMISPRLWLSAALALAIAGCSGRPSRVEAPDLKPKGVAEQAMARYDKNGDGKLAADELSPGLKALANSADADNDGALSETEIADRLAVLVESKIGLLDVGGNVLMDGRPLAGAMVRFVPDPILEGVVEPATGRTDEGGFVQLAVEGSDLPGVKPGFYRLEVSKNGAGGEVVPARYNTDSELGEEVAPDTMRGGLKIELSSR